MLEESRRRAQLPPQYFEFIDAVEYTRKHDDGAHAEGWHDADILILGVSRCAAACVPARMRAGFAVKALYH